MHHPRFRIRIRTLMIAVAAAALVTMSVQKNDFETMIFAQASATLFVTAILADVLTQSGERLRWMKRSRVFRRRTPLKAIVMHDEQIDRWFKDLSNGGHSGDSTAETIEKLKAAGPTALRRLMHLFAVGPANRFGWYPANLNEALCELSRADPETFLNEFPDAVNEGSDRLIQILARMDDPRVEQALSRLFWNSDPDPDRQYGKICVARALSGTPSPWVQRALIGALGWPRASLTRIVVQTLGAVGDEGAIEPLTNYAAAHAGEPFKLAEEAAHAIDAIRGRIAMGVRPAADSDEPPALSELDQRIKDVSRAFASESDVQALERMGVDALRRLFQTTQGLVRIPVDGHPFDVSDARSCALARLGRIHPEELARLAEEAPDLTAETIYGLQYTENARLIAIARTAIDALRPKRG